MFLFRRLVTAIVNVSDSSNGDVGRNNLRQTCRLVQDFVNSRRINIRIRIKYAFQGGFTGEMTSDIAAIQLLQNALNAAQLRQQVYANNVANVDTPGYKRQDVEFESLLAANMGSEAPQAPQAVLGQKYIPISLPTESSLNMQNALQVQPQIVQDTSTTYENNGNNVDIDAEMANLAQNQIHYNALIQDLQSRFSRLKTAINGGA